MVGSHQPRIGDPPVSHPTSPTFTTRFTNLSIGFLCMRRGKCPRSADTPQLPASLQVGNLSREGRICEECISHSVFRSVVHGCYHNSRLADVAVAGMLTDLIFGPSKSTCFSYAQNLRAENLSTRGSSQKRNFIAPGCLAPVLAGEPPPYVGRLSQEKGPRLLPGRN